MSVGVITAAALAISGSATIAAHAETTGPPLTVTPVVSGLSIPWDLAFAPDGTMLFDERSGSLKARLPNGQVRAIAADLSDIYAVGESGAMGLVVDPAFSTNRTFYLCLGHQDASGKDVRVVKWTVDASYTTATRGATLVQGIQNTGRHSGCRLRFDTGGLLFVSTGDAAVGTNPQNLGSLNGKVLRITTAGAPATGNPFASSTNANTRLIYTYGHRNVQGLSLRPGTNQMWSVEQGTDRDDEVNQLAAGRNYGYDPVPGYNESVPMTDTAKFPTAVRAVYSTGFPTLALSGGVWLSGSQWGPLDGVFVAEALKATRVKALRISAQGSLADTVDLPELTGTYGRLREGVQGPDGALYITTANGSGTDRILRVAPSTQPGEPGCAGAAHRPLSPVGSAATSTDVLAFGVGLDHNVWFRGLANPTWRSLGGTVKYGPAAVSPDGARVDLFAVDAAGSLVHRYRSPAGVWSSWVRLGGALTSSPAAVAFSGGRFAVYARGSDNAMWTTLWTGTSWTTVSRVGGILSAAPGAAVDSDTGSGRVQVRGSDGRVWEMAVGPAGPTTGFTLSGYTTCSGVTVAARSGDGAGFPFGYVGLGGRSEVFDQTLHNLGGVVLGAISLQTPDPSGFTAFGRGASGSLWVYDARTGPGAWRELGGRLI